METKSRIKFNPVTQEIEIEGSEKFVKTYFDKIQSNVSKINGDVARIKGTHYAIITPRKIKIAKKVK